MKTFLCGLNGYAGSGKDAVASILQELDPSIQNKKFSGKLKEVAAIMLGIDPKCFESQEFKSSRLSDDWWVWQKNPKSGGTDVEPTYFSDPQTRPMTVREFLQKLGTEAIRDGLHQNAWVNALFADYRSQGHVVDLGDIKINVAPSRWVVSDCRFENEAQAIKDRGGVIIRIDRPGVKPINNHPSETALDHWPFDYKIANVSDLVSLKFTVENIYKEII